MPLQWPQYGRPLPLSWRRRSQGVEEGRGSPEGEGLFFTDVFPPSSAPPVQSPVVTQFFPSLLLWAFTVIMPLIVYLSAFLEAHWTR